MKHRVELIDCGNINACRIQNVINAAGVCSLKLSVNISSLLFIIDVWCLWSLV